MSSLTLTEPKPGVWQFNGELGFAALSQTLKKLNLQRPSTGAWSIDLTKLTRLDSAGAAYLLDCIRYAEGHNIRLDLLGFPTTARGLVEAQGVADLLAPYIR